MYTVNYDYQPGETVFAVIDENRLEEATVLSVKFKVYEENNSITTELLYSLLLADAGDGMVSVDASRVFGTLQDASDYLENLITPTPTVTPSTTPS